MNHMLWLDGLKEDKVLLYAHNVFFPLFCGSLTVFCVLCIPYFFQERAIFALLLFLLAVLLLDAFFLFVLSWVNSRYSMDERGITVRSFFRTRTLPWSAIQEAGIVSIRFRTASIHDPFRPYLLLTLRRSSIFSTPLVYLHDLWRFRADALAVRIDKERLSAFEAASPLPIRYYDWTGRGRYMPREEERHEPPRPYGYTKTGWIAFCAKHEQAADRL